MHAKDMQNKLKVRFSLFYIKISLTNNLENNVEQTEPMQKNVLFHLRVQIKEINIKLLIFENWQQNKLNHRQENVLFNRSNLTRVGECSIGKKIVSRQQNKFSFAPLTPRTTMTPSIALRSPPPSIGLDGEPETIKEFAAKQH